jgi:hypothetical protein
MYESRRSSEAAKNFFSRGKQSKINGLEERLRVSAPPREKRVTKVALAFGFGPSVQSLCPMTFAVPREDLDMVRSIRLGLDPSLRSG